MKYSNVGWNGYDWVQEEKIETYIDGFYLIWFGVHHRLCKYVEETMLLFGTLLDFCTFPLYQYLPKEGFHKANIVEFVSSYFTMTIV